MLPGIIRERRNLSRTQLKTFKNFSGLERTSVEIALVLCYHRSHGRTHRREA
jgi:hypothetical protein